MNNNNSLNGKRLSEMNYTYRFKYVSIIESRYLHQIIFIVAMMCAMQWFCAPKIQAANSASKVVATTSAENNAEILDLTPVIVTASRTPESIDRLSRNVVVLTKEDVAKLPARSVPELLDYAAGVTVRQRGPGGVQADIHIRGSGFNQVDVLINGVGVNDAQTGHHNMDIPLNTGDIERIEILQGPGSSLYGPNAVGGVINIITKNPDATLSRFSVSAGKYGERSVALSLQGSGHSFSVKNEKSEGFRSDTDYDLTTISSNNSMKVGGLDTKLLLGYIDKHFGASGFYVPGWDSREHTASQFAQFGVEKPIKNGGFMRADIYDRWHSDRFECSIKNPSLCVNDHRTNRYGIELLRNDVSKSGTREMTTGLIYDNDRIKSSNMGRHDYNHYAAYVRGGARISKRLNLDSGIRADRHGGYGTRVSWSLSSAYRAAPHLTVKGSVGRAYRPPDFTELYYNDPVHVSFSKLRPETAASHEIGATFSKNRFEVGETVYSRTVSSLIDWTRISSAAPWIIGNTSARFTGVNSMLKFKASDKFTLSLSHDYFKVSAPAGLQYKYTGKLPTNQARIGLAWSPAVGKSLNVRMNYDKSKTLKNVTTVDTSIKGDFKNVGVSFQINNVFNRRYQDVLGSPMPGLTATIGMTWTGTK